MKKLLVCSILMLAVSGVANAGLKLKCNKDHDGFAGTVVTFGALSLDCVDKNNEPFTIDMAGLGLGALANDDASIRINCPLVNKSRIMSGKDLKMVAPKLEAGILIGGTAGLALNARGAFCTLVGSNNSLGASVTLNYMIIHHGTDHKLQLE